ncbi:MAG TPA: TonB-dependent receptor [Bryobacteraceae bacterium]|nr:TonB-dependent receptor [Bryobacteraceae bacterium]
MFRLVIRLSLLSTVAMVHLYAQATGRIEGTVLDPQEAVVAGAQIQCRNEATGLAYDTKSNAEGIFRFPDLAIGTYTITVSQQGFQKLVQQGAELLTGHTLDLRLRLTLGTASASVEITGEAPLMQTATSEVQTTIDTRPMSDLPLNGRNPLDLVVLTPGADYTTTGTNNGQQDNTGVTVNGLRSVDNNYELDGAGFVNSHHDGAPTLPNPDTLGEFTVQSANFSARESRAGAVVQLSTRSGTNRWSGSVFEYLRNDKMDARNFFDTTRQTFKRSQAGASLGGPIVHNRTFLFSSYQGTLKRGTPSPKLITVPTAAQRSGDFTAQASKLIVDPQTGQPFPGSVIPQSRFDPLALKLLPYVPLPNVAGASAARVPQNANQDDHQFVVKVDHGFSDANHLSVRFYDDWNEMQRDTGSVLGVYSDNRYHNQILTIKDTHVVSPNLTLSNSFSYAQTLRHQYPMAPIYNQDLTSQVPLADSTDSPELRVNVSGYFNLNSGGPIVFDPKNEELRSQASWSHGSHLIGFGTDMAWVRDYCYDASSGAGSWTFDATQTQNTAVKGSTGDAFASFLLGLPVTFAQQAYIPAQMNENRYHFWFQDDWKIHPRFTLNLGLRWEPTLQPTSGLGPLPALVPGMHSRIAPNAPTGLVFSGDLPNAISPNDWNNFAPRVGFAWDLNGSGKTVIRAGYGIYYRTPPLAFLRVPAENVPFESLNITINAPGSFANPYLHYPGGNPYPFTAPAANAISSFQFQLPVTLQALAIDPSTSYTQAWNFTIERQVLQDTTVSVGYVANHSLKILGGREGNPALYTPTATTGNIDSRRMYAGLSSITLMDAFQWGNYNSMQLTVTRRARHGLSVIANYVFSKSLDNATDGGIGGTAGQSRDPFDENLDKGPSDYDATHRVNVALLYDLPKLARANGFLRAVVNGWQVNSILTGRSGLPFTVLGLNRSLSGVNKDHADQIGDPARPAGVDPVLEWFNPSAFAANAPGSFGNSGRNILRGPASWNVNFSAFKNFRATERFTVQVRPEAFNLFNRANFGNPNATFNNVNYGHILSAADPRVLQMGLKLLF